MTLEDRVGNALRSPQPARDLRTLVLDLAREGRSKAAIYALLENYLGQVRTRPGFGEGDEEVMLDIMDALTGWCHPSAELLPEKPNR